MSDPLLRELDHYVVLDPTTGEGARLVQAVTDRSPAVPSLRVDGQEVVLVERPPVTRMK